MRPHGRARVSARSPRAFAVCDRCGFLFNHASLHWQHDWRGATIQNTRMLVCSSCLDKPQEQLRAIAPPADPTPIQNPRVQDYVAASSDHRITQNNGVDPVTGLPIPGGDVRTTQGDDNRVSQQTGEPSGGLNQTPGTDPNAPGNSSPGVPYDNSTVPETGPL